VDINLDIARRVAAILEGQQIDVDLLPSTVPVQYKADAFVALHGDANSNTSLSGYKLARSSRSSIPAKDDALLNAISTEYAAATGLSFHAGTITVNMTSYYAFANQGIQHSIAPTTPGVILEMGFLTTAKDRNLLMDQPDVVAGGIARGILKFLGK
jgi:N-acetylmuramoyl-L-alanine amidase